MQGKLYLFNAFAKYMHREGAREIQRREKNGDIGGRKIGKNEKKIARESRGRKRSNLISDFITPSGLWVYCIAKFSSTRTEHSKDVSMCVSSLSCFGIRSCLLSTFASGLTCLTKEGGGEISRCRAKILLPLSS